MEKIQFKPELYRREPKKSVITEIVNAYLEARGIDKAIIVSKEIKAKFPFPRMAARAKRLLEDCDNNLSDAMYCVTQTNYFL